MILVDVLLRKDPDPGLFCQMDRDPQDWIRLTCVVVVANFIIDSVMGQLEWVVKPF